MNEHLINLCKFLLERGKHEAAINGRVSKFYFIMQYPGNDKPVFSPLKAYLPLSNYSGPDYVQKLWDQRKETNPVGTQLLALASVTVGFYSPSDPGTDRMDKSGGLILASTMHMADRHISFGTLFELKLKGANFDAIMELNDEHTQCGCVLFPKNL